MRKKTAETWLGLFSLALLAFFIVRSFSVTIQDAIDNETGRVISVRDVDGRPVSVVQFTDGVVEIDGYRPIGAKVRMHRGMFRSMDELGVRSLQSRRN